LVEDAATARELPSGQSSCAVAATSFAVREAAGWHERRRHLAGLRSECQPAAERLNEDPPPRPRARAAAAGVHEA